jgi:hypothetical protein
VTTARDKYLLDRYGIKESTFLAILESQGGGCGICGRKRKKGEPNLHVDHCHKTGIIRGVLCKRCNERLLPAALDKPATLIAAAEYLERAAEEPWGRVPEDRKKSKYTNTSWQKAPKWIQPKGKERRM